MNYLKKITETPDFAEVAKSIAQNIKYRANIDDFDYFNCEDGDVATGCIFDVRAKINGVVLDIDFPLSATVRVKVDKGTYDTPPDVDYSIDDIEVDTISEITTDESEIIDFEFSETEKTELITLINNHLRL
ncbi:hypothetical protein FACS189434_09180 [Bacteroidia bacterium]|nr:hypothetical protein FACS189434_09180 [Bacteroidia bacterium]